MDKKFAKDNIDFSQDKDSPIKITQDEDSDKTPKKKRSSRKELDEDLSELQGTTSIYCYYKNSLCIITDLNLNDVDAEELDSFLEEMDIG